MRNPGSYTVEHVLPRNFDASTVGTNMRLFPSFGRTFSTGKPEMHPAFACVQVESVLAAPAIPIGVLPHLKPLAGMPPTNCRASRIARRKSSPCTPAGAFADPSVPAEGRSLCELPVPVKSRALSRSQTELDRVFPQSLRAYQIANRL